MPRTSTFAVTSTSSFVSWTLRNDPDRRIETRGKRRAQQVPGIRAVVVAANREVNVALAKLGLIAAGGLMAGGAVSVRLARRQEQRQLKSPNSTLTKH